MRPTNLVLGRIDRLEHIRNGIARAGASSSGSANDPGAYLRKIAKEEPEYVPTAPVLEGGRERSAIFGNYPTRTKINFALRRSKPDRSASWRLDPVAVMQNTPLRRCAATHGRLHTAYMMKLAPILVRDKSGTPRILAAPDGLQHPRYVPRRPGHGAWVALKPDLVAGIVNSKRELASLTKGPPKVADNIMEQVGAELVLRVAQELELLHARIGSAKPPARGECLESCKVLRPLSKAEMEGVKRGAAPRGAIAVMDVRFGAKSKLTAEERENPKVPMLRREGARNYDPEAGGDVPFFPLHALLGADPRCGALVEDVLSAQRVFTRRCAEAAGGHVTTPTAEVEAHREEEEAPLVAVQIPKIDKGRGGGVPLVLRSTP
ncbi:hypothetical protein CcaverHIS002_0502970 [Cutaneotrichosporon cavernicola]|nr:hypothetical protein CcaverHIS002_0502970 [Cutaneotrichosporon cavernicola]